MLWQKTSGLYSWLLSSSESGQGANGLNFLCFFKIVIQTHTHLTEQRLYQSFYLTLSFLSRQSCKSAEYHDLISLKKKKKFYFLGFFLSHRSNCGCQISISTWRLASGSGLTSCSYILHNTYIESRNRSVGHKPSNAHLNMKAEQTKKSGYF